VREAETFSRIRLIGHPRGGNSQILAQVATSVSVSADADIDRILTLLQ